VSRSALVVAAALFALGIFVWLFTTGREDAAPVEPAVAVRVGSSPEPAAEARPSGTPARSAAATPGSPPRISTRDEFIQALEARGRDGEKLLAAYQDWRVSRGYLGADPLTGITAENAPFQVYAAMDRTTLKSLADSGDLGAIQAYAAGSLPADSDTALDYFGRASELGSAVAMVEIASILGGGAGPVEDPRSDAMAWTLAAIRLHGPIVATPDTLSLVETPGGDPAALAVVCARSLAIFADLSATSEGQNNGTLPPVFLAEKDLYGRLPCRDTPAPVMPPRALERCTASPALDSNNRPVELWICGES